MIKVVNSHDLDCVCTSLDRFSHESAKMVEMAFDSLLKHDRRTLDEAQKIGGLVVLESKLLMQNVLSEKEISNVLSTATIVEVLTEIQKIVYSADKMINNLRKKIDEGVLFSDKALAELKDIFSAVLNCLKTSHDLFLTQNPVLVQHILRQTERYDNITSKYAEEHQDRLIRGVCLPKSSLIYLLVLETLKDILWYIKCIAKAFKRVN